MQNQWFDMTNKMIDDSYSAFKKVNDTNIKTFETLMGKTTDMMTSCVETAQQNFNRLTSAKDVQEFMAAQGEIARTCSEKMMTNYKDVVSVMDQAREELSDLAEKNIETAESNIKKATTAAKKAA